MNLLEHFAWVGAATLALREDGAAVTISASASAVGAGIALTFEGADRDWSSAKALVFTLRANGAHRIRFHIVHGNGGWTFYLIPRPGLTSRVVIPFTELTERPPNTVYPGYSRFGGGPQPVALNDVHSLSITFNQVASEEKGMELGGLVLSPAIPAPAVLDPKAVVDEFGQWTGERGQPWNSLEISAAWQFERLGSLGFPGQTDVTGADARQQIVPETGFFQLTTWKGDWYLVDPAGYPFLSIGCDCVRAQSEGPVGGRTFLFKDLKDAENRPHPPSTGPRLVRREPALWMDFYNRNLKRRYADRPDDWHDAWSEHTVARLRSWGFNTIGNWSDRKLTAQGRMPYTTNISSLAPLCAHLPDVYAPQFAEQVRALVVPEVMHPMLADPMLIGYFVGNEPHWTFGGHRHPFNDVFTSSEYPHTRAEAMDWVRQTYGDRLEMVNFAWGTNLESWDDLTRPGGIPDVRLGTATLKRDADLFIGRVLGEFYTICCREIRAADPNHLLLGGRFYSPNLPEPYLRACAPFDVFSFNFYNWDAPKDSIERLITLTGRPVLIGEFHYGVEGRGLTASLVGCATQDDRGLAYRHFVENALALPGVVGVHWFQWVDQPVTGRFDGECYNIGLVDITDIPYTDFLSHVCEAHKRAYRLHSREFAPYICPETRPPAW